MRIAAALVLAFALAAPAAAKDLRVAADGSGDFRTLSKALAAASLGDVLVIKKSSGMVGMVLKYQEGTPVVEGVIAGSPAAAAGVKKGDRVLAVDGFETASLKLAEVVARVRGPVGTTVTLKISDASGPREVPVVRGESRREIKAEIDKAYVANDEEDFETAASYAKKLAEDGVPAAQFMLASFYYNGKGVGKDLHKAFSWASKGAEGGDGSAQGFLAQFYQYGIVTGKNPVRAVYWNKLAVEQNNPHAMVNLGIAYESGEGVTVDPAVSLKLYRRALLQPLDAAAAADVQSRVERLEKSGEGK